MITVTIIGILVAVALPSYTRNVQEGRRADAQQYIMLQASVLERNYTRLGRYPDVADITFEASDYYSYKYVPDGDFEYELTAKPIGAQRDDACGVMTINQQGITTATNVSCWR